MLFISTLFVYLILALCEKALQQVEQIAQNDTTASEQSFVPLY